MRSKFYRLFALWTSLAAILMYFAIKNLTAVNLLAALAVVIGLSPAIGLLLTLSSDGAMNYFKSLLKNKKNALYHTAGALSILFVLPALLTKSFNPYFAAIFFITTLGIFGSLKQLKSVKYRLSWMDLIIWLLLWIPFDLRWTMELLPAVDTVSYTWWSIVISLLAVIAWVGFREADIGYRLAPDGKDVLVALTALALIMVLVIPPGLLSGFLTFAIPDSFKITKHTAHFIGLFLTVALPEELFFRGILLKGLYELFTTKWIALLISSLAFGLMHWNNVDSLSLKIIYVSLASVAGVGYGWAFQKSGNKLFAPILTHTLVDWIWKLLLSA